MYYRAEIYIESIVKNSFIAGSVDGLKSKAEPYIKDDKVTQIIVSEVKEIGFFKLPKEIEKVIEKELIL
ncbi:hypothetical protein [Clostridium sp. ZBS18]|uniref:hypothetical protein n=1 Tax=Clostridium sp. ZBS18 TaxID=2949967 RepID=UPI0020799362|nr:hypothetical protein [Clostridium sp. ZBS18]